MCQGDIPLEKRKLFNMTHQELHEESLWNQKMPLVKTCFEKFRSLISIDAEVLVGTCKYDAIVFFSRILSQNTPLSSLEKPVVLGLRKQFVTLAQSNEIVRTYLLQIIPVHEASHVEFRMFDPRFNEAAVRFRVILYYQPDLTYKQFREEIKEKREQILTNIDQLSNSQGRFHLTSEAIVSSSHVTGHSVLDLAYYDLATLTTHGVSEWEDSFILVDSIGEEIFIGDLRKQFPHIFNFRND